MTLTALDFPASPTNGQVYPDPPVTGQPQYSWNGTQWLSSKAAVTQIARTDALGWSGMQINGSMEVSQEKAVGAAATTNGEHICDGWRLYKNGTMAVNGRTGISPAFVPGIPAQIYVDTGTAQASLGASDFVNITQLIEGWRIARLAWGSVSARPITIGFWSGHQRTGFYTGAIRNGGSNRSYAFSYTQNVAGIAQFNTITIPGCTDGTWPTDNTAGLQISFAAAAAVGGTYTAPSLTTWLTGNYFAGVGQINAVAATSDVFRITGVIVLPGIEAPTAAQSPLIMRPYDQELLTCQRYYRQWGDPVQVFMRLANGQCVSATSAEVLLNFSPTMRTAPTYNMNGVTAVSAANGSLVAVTGISASISLPYSVHLIVTTGGGLVAGNATRLLANNSSVQLKLDARL